MSLTYMRTVDGVTVVLHNRPFHLAKDSPEYDKVVAMIESDALEDELVEVFTAVARKVEAAVNRAITSNMRYSAGMVLFRGEPIHGYAVDKLVELVEAGKDAKPLAMFLEKLWQNPSQAMVENLYRFLEYGRIPITPEGDFLAYKAIRSDWMDIHSGTFYNGIGANPKMPRPAVDDRREVTCSRGLHVCSFEYLPHFSHANGRVVVCRVNPRDVVAIPSDYNDTKMRVCEYEVVGEVEGYYKEHRDVIGGVGVWEPKYALYGRGTPDEDWWLIEENDEFGELLEEVDELLGDGDSRDADADDTWAEVKIVDQVTGMVVFRKGT